jgi:hypothetical protein
MKIHRPSKWKVLVAVLSVSGAMILTQPRTAHAFCIEPYSCAAIVGLAVTYATVLTTVCTPVAAVKAWNSSTSFTGAFKDCWYWHRPSQQAAPSQTSETEPTPQLDETESAGPQE